MRLLLAAVICAMTAASAVSARQAPPDILLSNGKIITVDDRFSIAQAVAIRGDRIVAVGSNQDVTRLAGPNTRRIDLGGRAVTPGLIDHHGHYLREGSTFLEEVRWEGVETRKQALDMLRAGAREKGEGAWLFNLMGWSLDQFTDDTRPFTREELDRVAPDNPVALQEAYYRIYLNSRALRDLGINETLPDPDWIPAGQVERDAAGRPTGVILDEGTRPLDAQLLAMPRSSEQIEASHAAMVSALNRAGLTTIGSTGCQGDGGVRSAGPSVKAIYQRWADAGQLTVRVFCMVAVAAGNTPEQVTAALPRIAELKLFQGSEYLDDVVYGEGVYGPASDNMLHVTPTQRPEDFEQWGRMAREIARAGLRCTCTRHSRRPPTGSSTRSRRSTRSFRSGRSAGRRITPINSPRRISSG